MRSGARRRSKPNSPPKKQSKGSLYTREGQSQRLKAQRAEDRERSKVRQLRKMALAARDAFRPRKSERGRLILVTTTGKRAREKGRKGYLVHVTKTGKKRLIRESGKHGAPTELRPRKLTDIEVPQRRNLRRVVSKFITARKEKIAHRVVGARKLNEHKTKIPSNTGGHDFSDATIKRIARDIKKALELTVSHRSYIISVIALVKFPDGSTDTIEFSIPIARQDHQAILLGGIENFVRFKFYAFMARELQFKGYVTIGSANHIRGQLGLDSASEVGQEEWTKYHGQSGHQVEPWTSPRFEICRLVTIEYKIERID